MIGIVDTHCHFVYDVDDGSDSYKMSKEMIKKSYEQGVRHIFCTSHSDCIEGELERYRRHFDNLIDHVQHHYSSLRLYLGSEVRVQNHKMNSIIDSLKKGQMLTMNNTKYVLAELGVGYGGGIAGGQASLYYGYEAIPQEWLAVIEKLDYVTDMCNAVNAQINE